MSSSEPTFEKIAREPLRKAIRRQLIDRLFAGELEPGQRLKERQLAEQLGISRTPLREALIGLQNEGLVEAHQSKGFQVASLDAETLYELCAIVGILESAVLRKLERPADERLDELDELTRRRAETDEPGEVIRLDAAWHRKLIGRSSNRELRKLIERVRRRLYFYEYTFLVRVGDISDSTEQHLQVTEALREDGKERAAELLESHWKTGIRRLTEWMDGTEDAPPSEA